MAYLKNGYKLMYEKIESTVRNLKATKTIPAEGDLAVSYKKTDGSIVDPKTFKLIFEKDGRFYGSVSGKVEEAVEFSIYSGNDLLLGSVVVPPVEQFQISAVGDEEKMIAGNFDICWNFQDVDPVTTIVRKTVNKGTSVRLYVEPNFSAEWDTQPTTCKVNNVDKALTAYGTAGYYYIDIIVNEDTQVIFNTGTTRVPPVAE